MSIAAPLRLVASVLVLVLVSASPALAADVHYAIVIGNNAPPAGEPLAALRFADDDAARYYGVLARLSESVVLLTVLDADSQKRYPTYAGLAQRPTLKNLRVALERLRPSMERDLARGDRPVLYLTFSGHGTLDARGRGQLSLLDEPLTQAVLYDELLASIPDVWTHLIVDACHAGAVVGVRGGESGELDTAQREGSAEEVASLLQQAPLARFPHVGALIATARGQEAHEWQEVESGVFTHEVISALVGAADVNADGRVQYTEVEAFAAAANRTLPDPRAVAHIKVHLPVADGRAVLLPVAALRDSVRLHAPRAGTLGRFHVELGSGLRYAEGHLSADAPLSLWLPAGAGPAFLRTASQEAAIALSGPPVALSELRFGPRRQSARGSLDSAYSRHLFESPYGPDYYRGFVDRYGLTPALQADAAGAREPERSAVLATGLWVLSGAALVTSGVTGVLAFERKAELDDTALERRAHELDGEYRTLGTVSLVSLGVAAASLGGGLYLWLSADPGPSEEHVQFRVHGSF